VKLLSSAILSETDASYVKGSVEVRRTPAAGVTQDFAGIGLHMTASGATLPGSTLVTRVTGTAPVGVHGNEGILRYFDITAANNSGLNINMTIDYMPHELNGTTPARLSFYKSVDNGANWMPRGRNVVGASSVTLNSVSGFSRWTLGDEMEPLPVSLMAFRAERQGREALLTWTTASEQQNRGFGVEVSTDGKVFRELGFVAAETESSNSPRSYRYADASTGKAGIRYYRLRQEDFNGKVFYSAPQTLRFEAAASALAAYPSHFEQQLMVDLVGAPASSATLRLIDSMGREVWRSNEVLTSGTTLQVQPSCAPGTYLLTAEVGGQVLRQRVVKQ
jgi:hypothetical protein